MFSLNIVPDYALSAHGVVMWLAAMNVVEPVFVDVMLMSRIEHIVFYVRVRLSTAFTTKCRVANEGEVSSKISKMKDETRSNV